MNFKLQPFFSSRRPTCQPPSPTHLRAPALGSQGGSARPLARESRGTTAPIRPLALPSSLHLSVPAPFSSETLAPLSSIAAPAWSSAAAVDSSSHVSHPSIPRAGSSLSLSSSDSDAYPALGLAVQGRRRSPPSAAAHRRGAAASPPLLACATAGEARRLLLIPVRAAPGPLRPRSVAPPSAGAAACARRARGRAQARGQGSPWP